MVLKIVCFYDDHVVMDDLSNEPWQAYSDNARKEAMDGSKEARPMWVIY